MGEALKGSCMCGAVKFSATPSVLEMSVCHCSMCRNWSGGSYMAVACDEMDVVDDKHLKTFGSSEWGERQFCGECGSTLVWRMKSGEYLTVSAQAFDDPSVFKFTSQIFTDHKPDNYDFANETQNMTQAEVMALFALDGGA